MKINGKTVDVTEIEAGQMKGRSFRWNALGDVSESKANEWLFIFYEANIVHMTSAEKQAFECGFYAEALRS